MSDGIMSRKWFRWMVAIASIVAVLFLSWVVWNAWGKPEVNDEAMSKAQKLFDLAQEAGLLQKVEDESAFVEDLARIFGDDGGYGAEFVRSSLAETALTYNLARTGEVTQRPIIAEPKFIEFELLVMKVYRPDIYREKILPYIRGLKLEGELPAWLQKDLDTM